MVQVQMGYGGACGGSLIANNLVLSAGHCFYSGKSVDVYVGTNVDMISPMTRLPFKSYGSTKVHVKEVILHSECSSKSPIKCALSGHGT